VHVGAQYFSNWYDVAEIFSADTKTSHDLQPAKPLHKFPEMWVCLGRRPRVGVRALAIAWSKSFRVVLHDLYLRAAPRLCYSCGRYPAQRKLFCEIVLKENQNTQMCTLFFIAQGFAGL